MSATAGNLVGASFLTGLLLFLGADDTMIGLVTVAGLLGNLLQILSPILFERMRSRRGILIASRAAIYLLNIVAIGLIPLMPVSNGLRMALIVAVVGLVNTVSAITSPGMQVMQIANVPQMNRARFFSYSQLFNGIFVFSVALAAGAVLDRFKASGMELAGFEAIRAAALLFATLDLAFFLRNIRELPVTPHHETVTLGRIFVLPFRERRYLRSVAVACAWAYPANINGYFFIAYLLNDLHLKYSYLTAVDLLNIVMLVLFTNFWKGRILKTSYLRTMAVALLLCVVHLVLMSLIAAGTVWMYPFVMSIFFLLVPGINIVMAYLPFHDLPPTNQTNYLGFYAAVTNLAAMLGILSGRAFLGLFEGADFTLFGMRFVAKQSLMLFNAGMMLLGALFVFRMARVERREASEAAAAADSGSGNVSASSGLP
jgi:MFS family permease